MITIVQFDRFHPIYGTRFAADPSRLFLSQCRAKLALAADRSTRPFEAWLTIASIPAPSKTRAGRWSLYQVFEAWLAPERSGAPARG